MHGIHASLNSWKWSFFAIFFSQKTKVKSVTWEIPHRAVVLVPIASTLFIYAAVQRSLHDFDHVIRMCNKVSLSSVWPNYRLALQTGKAHEKRPKKTKLQFWIASGENSFKTTHLSETDFSDILLQKRKFVPNSILIQVFCISTKLRLMAVTSLSQFCLCVLTSPKLLGVLIWNLTRLISTLGWVS